jgi:hypothetical protein
MAIPTNNPYTLSVYIWDTSFRRGVPGHTSLKIQKETNQASLKKNHFGFYPKGTFIVSEVAFHSPARVEKSLYDEIYSQRHFTCQPDQEYQIRITKEQYKKIKGEMNKYLNNIETGQTQYAWLAPISHFFYPNCTSDNCSTAAKKILNAGDIPIVDTNIFWGLTPSDVSKQLSHLLSAKKIEGQVVHYKKTYTRLGHKL